MSPSDPAAVGAPAPPEPEADDAGAHQETAATTPLPDSDPGDRPVDGSVMSAGDADPA